MAKRLPPRSQTLRQALAQEAARVMAEHGVRDFLFAKRKAAERLGIVEGASLPRNAEIEAALAEYQRLFGGDEHARSLQAQRLIAIEAMRMLHAFQPRLVGSVLAGTATTHATVQLHAFADRAESVGFALMDRGVDYEVSEKQLKMGSDRTVLQPMIEFEIDGQLIEIVVFSIDGIRQAPTSPVDGRPMRRADLGAVEALLAEAAG